MVVVAVAEVGWELDDDDGEGGGGLGNDAGGNRWLARSISPGACPRCGVGILRSLADKLALVGPDVTATGV